MKYLVIDNEYGGKMFIDFTEEQTKFLRWCLENEYFDSDRIEFTNLEETSYETF